MRLAILLIFLFLLDLYVYQAVKIFSQERADWLRISWRLSYWITTVTAFGLIIAMASPSAQSWSEAFLNYARAGLFVFYISKFLFALFLLLDDIRRLIQYLILTFRSTTGQFEVHRSEVLMGIALFIALIPFSSLIYGMVRNPYRYQVLKETIEISSLKQAPDLKIVHISDIHSGSFSDPEAVSKGIELINNLEPDLVFFTGDIVNNRADELEPYVATFSKIKAKKGVYSVLGNHDYGDYVFWETPDAKRANLQKLMDLHAAMGWTLLMDEHRTLDWYGKQIVIAGIQNASGSMRFKSIGNPRKALEGVKQADVTLMLSHDPSFWESGLLTLPHPVDVTFSGHTHGFQFGVEIPGWFKWSPVQYVYKQWAGLYNKGDRYLYVNRGFGFLGYPGRVGILPEITEISLTGAGDPL